MENKGNLPEIILPDGKTVTIWKWRFTPQQASVVRVVGAIPFLGLAGWLLQNFLQLRGVVNLVASRIDLGFLALCIIVIGFIVTAGLRNARLWRALITVVCIMAALLTDYVAPRPTTLPSVTEPLASRPDLGRRPESPEVHNPGTRPSVPQKQRVELIFKDSPLLTDSRKRHISKAIDECYEYLQSVGFAVSVKMPPLGVSDRNVLLTSGIYPGTIYDSQIYLPRNSLDNMDEIRKLYLICIFRNLLRTDKMEQSSEIAASVFAVYYASSLVGRNLDRSDWSGRKWTRALWEVRQKEGKEAADQYMYFTYVRWNDIQIPAGQSFDESFRTRFLAGVWVKANGDRLRSVMNIVAKHLANHEND